MYARSPSKSSRAGCGLLRTASTTTAIAPAADACFSLRRSGRQGRGNRAATEPRAAAVDVTLVAEAAPNVVAAIEGGSLGGPNTKAVQHAVPATTTIGTSVGIVASRVTGPATATRSSTTRLQQLRTS